jgi:hypothetical protein
VAPFYSGIHTANLDEIVEARWDNLTVYNVNNLLLTIKRKHKDSLQNDSVAFLSPAAKLVVDHLNNERLSCEFLFPKLRGLKKQDRIKALSITINRHWNKYRVDPNGFVKFFTAMAIQHSGFSKAFIETMLERDHDFCSLIVTSFNKNQRNLLFGWWGRSLWPTQLTRPFFSDDASIISSTNIDMTSPYTSKINVAVNLRNAADQKNLTGIYTIDNVMCWYGYDNVAIEETKRHAEQIEITEILPNAIKGKVFKNSQNMFEVTVDFYKNNESNLSIKSTCTCNKEMCEHGAMLLIFNLNTNQSNSVVPIQPGAFSSSNYPGYGRW